MSTKATTIVGYGALATIALSGLAAIWLNLPDTMTTDDYVRFSAFGAAVVGLCLSACFLLLRSEATRNNNDFTDARWFEIAAWLLMALGVYLTLSWAYTVRAGLTIGGVAFIAAFIGFIVLRIKTVDKTVSEAIQGNYGAALAAGLLAIMPFFALLATSFFDATNYDDRRVQERIEASKPAEALDAQIAQTQQQITALAAFANPEKATQEQQHIAEVEALNQQRRIALNAEIETAKTELLRWATATTSCETNGTVLKQETKQTSDGLYYSSKAQAACAKLRSALAQAQGWQAVPIATYSQNHERYLGLQNHLATLQQQRADLSQTGNGIKTAHSGDTRAIAWIFGVSNEVASRYKWLFYTVLFDLVGLLADLFAKYLRHRNGETYQKRQQLKRKIKGLEMAGVNLETILDGKGHVPNATTAPHLREGGRIKTDGFAILHANEVVLNADATAEIDTLFPGWLDQLNAKHRRAYHVTTDIPTSHVTADVHTSHVTADAPTSHVTADSPTSHVTADAPTSHVTVNAPTSHVTANVPTSHVTADMPTFHVAADVPTSHVTADAPTSHVTADMPTFHVAADMPTFHVAADVHTSHVAADVPTSHVTADMSQLERVPAHLSGKATKGRQGKVDSCLQCGADYIVTKWNKVYCCPDCAVQASGYDNDAARRKAYNSAKHTVKG